MCKDCGGSAPVQRVRSVNRGGNERPALVVTVLFAQDRCSNSLACVRVCQGHRELLRNGASRSEPDEVLDAAAAARVDAGARGDAGGAENGAEVDGAGAVPAFDARSVKPVTMPRLEQLYSTTSKATLAKQRVLSAHLLKNSAKLRQLREQASPYAMEVMEAQKAQCVLLQTVPADRASFNSPQNRMNCLLKGRQAGK